MTTASADPLDAVYSDAFRNERLPLAWVVEYAPDGDLVAGVLRAWTASRSALNLRMLVLRFVRPLPESLVLYCYACWLHPAPNIEKPDCAACVEKIRAASLSLDINRMARHIAADAMGQVVQ